jgi:hypothetical protein
MNKDTKLAIIYAIATFCYFAICLYILTPMVMDWMGK